MQKAEKPAILLRPRKLDCWSFLGHGSSSSSSWSTHRHKIKGATNFPVGSRSDFCPGLHEEEDELPWPRKLQQSSFRGLSKIAGFSAFCIREKPAIC
ncbi:hypothetical protein B9Z55_003869 [Caenorhabditis nigoni]|uniref:Uncharacterized protein n=1 Tax=Caenorhabditis nigoni TaxID=1611254 RepID=A0A2G5VT68_9PELO|nr:hypothetical protein B9Z55_003869 [Caenorhabditis nigoni]